MTDFTIQFSRTGSVRIDWNKRVSGMDLLKQKLVVNFLTDVGTDQILPTRGTKLRRQMLQGYTYDINSLQHALNFAALDARNMVTAYADITTPLEEQATAFRAVLQSVTNGAVNISLVVGNAAGQTLGTATLTL